MSSFNIVVLEVRSPSTLRVTNKGTLNTASCLSPSEIREVEMAITNNLSGVKCSTDTSCQTKVTARDDACTTSGRRKRSPGTTVNITLLSAIADGDLELAEFLASKTGIQCAKCYRNKHGFNVIFVQRTCFKCSPCIDLSSLSSQCNPI